MIERKTNIQRDYVYLGPCLRVREDRFTKDGKERIYNVAERSNSVVIFPITPSRRTILLKHFRYPTQKYSMEIPMGGVDEGESIEQAAKREFFEEVKMKSTGLEHIGKFNPVPGLTNQQVDIFIARVDESSLDNASIEQNEDGIDELFIIDVNEVYEKVSKGDITDGFTLASLIFLKLYLDRENPQH